MNELLRLCHDVVDYSVHTCHPHFKNQLYGGTDPYGLAGAWLAEALNTNMYVTSSELLYMLIRMSFHQTQLTADSDVITNCGNMDKL